MNRLSFVCFFILGTASASTVVEYANKKGKEVGIDPLYVLSVVDTESKGKPNAVSPKGALGLMQLMPKTAEFMGIPRENLFDSEQNMEAGVRYLSRLKDLFGGNLFLMAAAYNSGEGTVGRYRGIPPYKETKNYVSTVMTKYFMLKSCGLDCYTRKYMDKPELYWKQLTETQKQNVITTSQFNSNEYDSKEHEKNVFRKWLGLPVEQKVNLTKKQSNQVDSINPKFVGDRQKPIINVSETTPVQVKVVKPIVKQIPNQSQSDSFVSTLSEDGQTFVAVGQETIQ